MAGIEINIGLKDQKQKDKSQVKGKKGVVKSIGKEVKPSKPKKDKIKKVSEKESSDRKKEPRKEFRKEKKKSESLPVLAMSKSITTVFDDDSLIQDVFDKAKYKLSKEVPSQNVSVSKRMEEGVICPEEISSHVDSLPDYEDILSSPAPENVQIIKNNDNNGNLFVNGVPFWMLKDEPVVVPPYVTIAQKLEDILNKKFKMLESEPRPVDLDINNDLEYMKSRDFEHFDKPNRIMSNTLHSIIHSKKPTKKKKKKNNNSIVNKLKSSHDRAEEKAEADNTKTAIFLKDPERILVYDRKDAISTMRFENFTPGLLKLKAKQSSIMKKKKKKKSTSGSLEIKNPKE